MIHTPKSLRLQIALLGRTNVGKSSFLNLVANQEVSIVSPVAGTTTDIVEKSMELMPVGPVTFLDTGGIDDRSILSEQRVSRTLKILDRADVVVLLLEPNIWTEYEENIVQEAKKRNTPIILIINKCDLEAPKNDFINTLNDYSKKILQVSSIETFNRNLYINEFKEVLQSIQNKLEEKVDLLGDILQPGSLAVFIVPIDSEAPKGRLILPQVQAIRNVLDSGSAVVVVRDTEYKDYLKKLSNLPDLVVCDSQVVHRMVADTPPEVKCTTFSILFSRYKGDLLEEVIGSAHADFLNDGDRVLIAEACSHHPLQDDIGRIKIPHWLQQYLRKSIQFEVVSGKDFPEDLTRYKLIIHCGSCMLTRTEKLNRIRRAKEARVPITNYGIIISKSQGVLERVLSPFPDILNEYRRILDLHEKVVNL
jgi:[FeFe] hydrogenase H-cluster maturation GTPase HydF